MEQRKPKNASVIPLSFGGKIIKNRLRSIRNCPGVFGKANGMSDELLIRFCAPTLAGLKTGSMFSCGFSSREALCGSVLALNRQLVPKGLRVLPLRFSAGRGLIYVYRPGQLARDLGKSGAETLLDGFDYPHGSVEQRLVRLMQRLRQDGEFPHEIGLFLGYPAEDVAGFIERRESSTCTGCWRVYGDRNEAQKIFARFKKCTEAYCAQYRRGISVEALTVTGA